MTMRGPAIFLGLTLLAVAAAPLGQAQQQAALSLEIAPPSMSLSTEVDRIDLPGRASFIADASVYSSMSGVPVAYTIADAPPWATVVIEPSTDLFPVPATPGPTYTAVRPFTLTIFLSQAVPEDAAATIRVVAHTAPTQGGMPATGLGETLILVDAAEICDAPHEVEPLPREVDPDAGEEASEDDTVTTQSVASRPLAPASIAAVSAFALIGGGIGLMLRRRAQ